MGWGDASFERPPREVILESMIASPERRVRKWKPREPIAPAP